MYIAVSPPYHSHRYPLMGVGFSPLSIPILGGISVGAAATAVGAFALWWFFLRKKRRNPRRRRR